MTNDSGMEAIDWKKIYTCGLYSDAKDTGDIHQWASSPTANETTPILNQVASQS